MGGSDEAVYYKAVVHRFFFVFRKYREKWMFKQCVCEV